MVLKWLEHTRQAASVSGIILLLSFFGLAYYCIKGHNLMIGFLCITILWTVLPLRSWL